MWISNTATTMLMVTIATPLLARLADEHGEDAIRPVAIAFLLTIAYSANIGGMDTPVGTATNLVFMQTVSAHRPTMTPSFPEWMMIGLPTMAAGLIVLMLLMRRRLAGVDWRASDTAIPEHDRCALGPMRREEKIVAWTLAFTALAWMSARASPRNH